MQAAGNLVAVMVKLPAGMKGRHDYIQGIAPRLVGSNGYAPPVIFN